MSDENRNYLLDYRESGDLGPLKLISLNFAVNEEDYQTTVEWLRGKILRNNREFTLGEYGPFKDPNILVADPKDLKVEELRRSLSSGELVYEDGIIIKGMRERP
ncbi:MAG: hypothetical protein E7Z65_06325 [Thermoplasmata archaeon]|nr:hypothetical protein [Thermoplasmata archaeon]